VLDPLAVNLGVNNLFDESYGTQRRTGSQKGIFPGPTRAFYLSASARVRHPATLGRRGTHVDVEGERLGRDLACALKITKGFDYGQRHH
jgi:hypothetical protein